MVSSHLEDASSVVSGTIWSCCPAEQQGADEWIPADPPNSPHHARPISDHSSRRTSGDHLVTSGRPSSRRRRRAPLGLRTPPESDVATLRRWRDDAKSVAADLRFIQNRVISLNSTSNQEILELARTVLPLGAGSRYGHVTQARRSHPQLLELQMAAEAAYKALLLQRTGAYPHTHDLHKLSDEIRKFEGSFAIPCLSLFPIGRRLRICVTVSVGLRPGRTAIAITDAYSRPFANVQPSGARRTSATQDSYSRECRSSRHPRTQILVPSLQSCVGQNGNVKSPQTCWFPRRLAAQDQVIFRRVHSARSHAVK